MAKTVFPHPRFIAGTTRHHRLSAFALCIALRQEDPLAVREAGETGQRAVA